MNDDLAAVGRPSVWGSRIPPRPPFFTGREKELRALHTRLNGGDGPRTNVLVPTPQAFHGLGGVGKTAIAVEYAYRHAAEYDIVWWIDAASPDLIATSFALLGRQLDLPPTEPSKMPWAVRRLLCGTNAPRWLLIFDDAASPDDVQAYLPQPAPAGGHVIITSRVRDWLGRVGATGTEVGEFSAEEAVGYLRNRVPALRTPDDRDPGEEAARAADAAKMTEALGHLPLAIVHAGAYLDRTGLPVDSYLEEFQESPHSALSRSADISYGSSTIAATWSLSLQRVGQDAQHIFRLLAFFAPARVAQELLQRPGIVDGPGTLGDALSDGARFQTALDELTGFSLVRFDGRRRALQMHRVVQKLTQDQTRIDLPEDAEAYQRAVHALLASSDPRAPDRDDCDRIYNRSLPHLLATGAVSGDMANLRELIVNQVRRLHLRGRHTASLELGERALREWEAKFGEDDLTALRLATEVGMALRLAERHEDAFERNRRTLKLAERLADQASSDHVREAARRIWLICSNSYGGDLRFRGHFQEALQKDEELLPQFEAVFTANPENSLNVRNNLAADHRRLGNFAKAMELDEETYNRRKSLLGPANPRTLASLDSLARDLRELGEYDRALEKARSVCAEFGPLHDQNLNPDLLNAHRGLAVALRKAGRYGEAVEQGRRALEGYRSYLRENHRYTLIAAADQIAHLRLGGLLSEAEELGRETLEQCGRKDVPISSITFATQVNLAAVLRQFNNPADAQDLDRKALQGLSQVYGPEHPFTIIARIGLANDLFVSGEVREARELDEDTWTIGRRMCLYSGPEPTRERAEGLPDERELQSVTHPTMLALAANLSIDVRATGDEAVADRLRNATLGRYGEVLSPQHPEAALVAQRQRVSPDIEPY
ncbi:FxSxx-COOH system tetratricopeptide repeat protein [Spirillospora sp. CA-253888]